MLAVCLQFVLAVSARCASNADVSRGRCYPGHLDLLPVLALQNDAACGGSQLPANDERAQRPLDQHIKSWTSMSMS